MADLCSNCHENPPVRGQRYCKPCRAAYMVGWRKRDKERRVLRVPRGAMEKMSIKELLNLPKGTVEVDA